MGRSGQGGSVWIGRGGDSSDLATPLGDASGSSEALELLIDGLIDMIHFIKVPVAIEYE